MEREVYTIVDMSIIRLVVKDGICVKKSELFSINSKLDDKTKAMIKKVIKEVKWAGMYMKSLIWWLRIAMVWCHILLRVLKKLRIYQRRTRMKTITLTKVDNYNKWVRLVHTKHGLRCECGANIRYLQKYCWWCGGMYNWQDLRKNDGRF